MFVMADPTSDSRLTVAAVVPAHNEAERIGAVLERLIECAFVDDIIVVDDGSTDETARVAAGYQGVRVIRAGRNLGKGGALQAGFASTDADIVCTIDADLVGLTQDHLRRLVEPLIGNPGLSMTVGQFVGGRKRTDWAQTLVKSISGQRAMRREFLATLPDLSTTGFGVETLVTKHAKAIGATIEMVALPGLTQVMKEEKLGVAGGAKSRLKMYAEMIQHSLPRKAKRRQRNEERP